MAQLVSLVVHDPGRVEAVIRAWVEAGVSGLTLLDSCGLAQHLAERDLRDDYPLFPSVRRILQGTERHNRLLFSIVADEFDLDVLVAATEKALGPLSEPETGILFVTPVTRVVGLQPGSTSAGRG
jgi:nitrogen regulatory protein PII